MSTVRERVSRRRRDVGRWKFDTDLYDAKGDFKYGYRDVLFVDADGIESWEQLPLTEEDLLYPLIDDHHMKGPAHAEDSIYLAYVIKCKLTTRPLTWVLANNPIRFPTKSRRPLGPDVCVVFGVEPSRPEGEVDLTREPALFALVIELTSRSTRRNDLKRKPFLYEQAGVAYYLIVDYHPTYTQVHRLLGYRMVGDRFVLEHPDDRGRIFLDAVGLEVGIDGVRVALYEPGSDQPLPTYEESLLALRDAEELARAEAASRREAEELARAEAASRGLLEERLRRLESEIDRLRSGHKDAP